MLMFLVLALCVEAALAIENKTDRFWSCPQDKQSRGVLQRASGPEASQDVLLVSTFFRDTCHGTVLEIGANEGTQLMTSLEFSKRGWRTVLIEGDPSVFARLEKNRPDAMTIHAIAGREVRNETWITFNNPYLSGVDAWLPWEKLSRMIKAGSLREKSRTVLLASPLSTLMLQRGVWTVDLFSLDVEGSERAVLETINYDVINVGVLLIERGRYKGIPAYLSKQGVEYVGNILYDAVFVSRKYRESTLKEPDGSPSSLAALSQRLNRAVSRPSMKKRLCACMANVKSRSLSQEASQDCTSFCVGEGTTPATSRQHTTPLRLTVTTS